MSLKEIIMENISSIICPKCGKISRPDPFFSYRKYPTDESGRKIVLCGECKEDQERREWIAEKTPDAEYGVLLPMERDGLSDREYLSAEEHRVGALNVSRWLSADKEWLMVDNEIQLSIFREDFPEYETYESATEFIFKTLNEPTAAYWAHIYNPNKFYTAAELVKKLQTDDIKISAEEAHAKREAEKAELME